MSDNDLLSCTNSLVTIMVVINYRNIPRGPRCLQREKKKKKEKGKRKNIGNDSLDILQPQSN